MFCCATCPRLALRAFGVQMIHLTLRHEISPGKGETWKQNETFCRYPVGNQSHPIKPGRQSEASLACLRGDFWA